MDRVIVFDTTLRDGEQAPGATLTIAEKLEIARQLERLGVDVIEAGFPVTSPGDYEAVRTISREVRSLSVCGLTHAKPEAIDLTWEALKDAADPCLHIVLSSSDVHALHMLRKTRDEVLEMATSCVRHATRYTSNIEFSPMDASRSDPVYLCQLLEAVIDAGATIVNIPDTVGYAYPWEFGDLIYGIRRNVPNIERAVISVHCHNDLGLAVANTLEALRRGARRFEGTINGIGERAGNCAIEEVVMALKTRRDYFDLDTRIDTTQIYKTSRMVADLSGLAVQANKAIVGANAFRHESGLHQDGILKERTTFEIMDPRSIGLPSSVLVLGKHSGRHAFRRRLEDLGFRLSAADFTRAFARFKELADKKKIIDDRDLESIVADELRTAEQIYRLTHVQVSCGEPGVPTATVRITAPDGAELVEVAIGTGPVDAVYKAITAAISHQMDVSNRLTEFSVKSVTEGIDAIGEVTIRIEDNGHVFIGRGATTDIIVASARAYMNALNRLVALKQAEAKG